MSKILIVDDIAVNREILLGVLGPEGHELLEAADGLEALELVRANRPNLVICDILMPTMDGYEFVRLLRADPALAQTMVIYCTAYYFARESRNLARACGVSQVLVKPYEPSEILRAVRQVLLSETTPLPTFVAQEFDREHIRLITDKLSETVSDLQMTNERLAALAVLNLQLASEREPQALLKKVCQGARDLIGADYAVLCVKLKNSNQTVSFTSGIESTLAGKLGAPEIHRGHLGEVLDGRSAYRKKNRTGHAAAIGLPESYPPVYSSLIVPVASQSQTYGWICLVNKLGAVEFSEEHERILSILATQLGRIYENANLYAEVQRRTEQLQSEVVDRKVVEEKIRRLNRVYAFLSGVNSMIARARDRSELFDEACRIAVVLGQLKMAWVGVVDREAMRIDPVASALVDDATLAVVRGNFSLREDTQYGKSILAHAVRERKMFVMNDIANDPDAYFAKERVQRGILSMAMLPLVVSDDTVAVLALYAGEVGFFDEEEIKLLTSLAGNIAYALDHIGKGEKLNYLAYYDAITSLPNRTLFLERVNQYLRPRDGAKSVIALALIDIDRFRTINDTLGRQVGDEMLKLVAQRMRLREDGFETLAHVGADCFAVVLVNPRDVGAVAFEVEDLLRGCFAEPFELRDSTVQVAGKAGIAVSPADGEDGETLLRNAEAAIKRAKRSAAPLLFYAPEMNTRVAAALDMESRLRRALELDQFVLHYQPKVILTSDELSGVEALLRWNDPKTGIVHPARFISTLEETGLIYDVGRWVLRQAIKDYLRWRRAGLAAVRIAVNVSPVQLRDRGFVTEIAKAIDVDALAGVGLELELTESLIMEDVATSIGSLQAVRAMGVKIAIDDFGTGYSSLSYLSKLPVDTLKIDRSFVEDMNGKGGRVLVSTIITLAHSLKLIVVAEGVETEEQAGMLRSLSCDEMQGFLFSKPLPCEDFEARFLRRPEAMLVD